MASAMRKMAVYLGLVEDDHRYDDHYQDEYVAEEYEEYGAEFIDPGDAPKATLEYPDDGRATAEARDRLSPSGPRCRRPIWRGSPPCIRAHTMRPVRSESTSATALR